MKWRVAVVGVTGYSGLELMRIILGHSGMECVAAMASEATGRKAVVDIHPQLRGRTDLMCEPQNADRLGEARVDTAFLCTPNEVSYELAPKLLALGIRVIDLSGSFRLKQSESYSSWYGFAHSEMEALHSAVYGLPEWNARRIAGAQLVANPGCYPTSVLLPLLPLARSGMLEPGSYVCCDSKSGVTGAGRSARLDLMFGEISENFRPYNPIRHRHAPEICQELPWDLESFTFVPHLLPVSRGIVSTMYVSFSRPLSSEEIAAEFDARYGSSPFVRVLGDKLLPELRSVNYTNFCDVAWRLTSAGRRGVLFSAIDNLVKGAAGQAVQNFNLMHGLDETAGLMESKGAVDR